MQPYEDQESVVIYRPHGLSVPAHLIDDDFQVLLFYTPRHQRRSLHKHVGRIIMRIQNLSLGRLFEVIEQAGNIGTVFATMVHHVVSVLDVDSDRLIGGKYEVWNLSSSGSYEHS